MSGAGRDARSEAWRELHEASSRELAERLRGSFAALEAELAAPPEERAARPGTGAWSSDEVLEHVALTSRYLLVLARKLRDRSLARVEEGEPWPAHPPDHGPIAAVATDRRRWPHPDHMTPSGTAEPSAVRAELRRELAECLALLDACGAGRGTLHTIRMSVLDRRVDLYQLLDFLGRHAERHLAQIARNRATFLASGGPGDQSSGE